MAINITSILSAINAKNNNADSTYSNFELSQINKAVNTINSENGVITYRSVGDLPTGDSATIGQLAFIDRSYSWQDSDDAPVNNRTGSFYFYDGTNWSAATLTSDSNFANPASGGGGGGASLQGSLYGYATGGIQLNIIQKFPFASEGQATDVGDLISNKWSTSNSSSSTHGYAAGGETPPKVNVIEKFPFTVDANSTDVGDLTVVKARGGGANSLTYGYTAGGTPNNNVIDKFPFSVDANATDVGDLIGTRWGQSGGNSPTFGYAAGGNSLVVNTIQKWSFDADGNTTDVGDLLSTMYQAHYNSSSTHGYTVGGRFPAYSNVIQKYAFATDGNSTDVADFIHTIALGGRGPDYTTHGYQIGGNSPQSGTERYGYTKHSFVADENSTDVGELVTTGNFYNISGNHV